MKKFLSLTLLCLLFAASANAELTHPKSHVLLIGVSQYPAEEVSIDTFNSISFSALKFTVKDMEGLRDALKKANFCRDEDIRVLREPTARDMDSALRNMLDKVETGDRVLVAFSGHGISLPEGGKMVDFLCAADAKVTCNTITGDFTYTGLVRRSTMEQYLDVSKAEIKLVFIDACRNALDNSSDIARSGDNPGIKGIGNVKGAGTFGGGAASDIQNQGFFRFSSCEPGQVSWEFDNQEHGAFTYFLIKGMLGDADDRGRGVITLADLQSYVRKETEKYVSYSNKKPTQIPVVWRLPEARITENDVLFSFFTPIQSKNSHTEPNDDVQQTALGEFDRRMQTERAVAIEEWKRKNPPPQSPQFDERPLLGALVNVAEDVLSRQKYNPPVRDIAENLDQVRLRRAQELYARKEAVMREQLAVYSTEMESMKGSVALPQQPQPAALQQPQRPILNRLREVLSEGL